MRAVFSIGGKVGRLKDLFRLSVVRLVAPDHPEQLDKLLAGHRNEEARGRCDLEIMTKTGRPACLDVNTRLDYREGKAVGIRGIAREAMSNSLRQAKATETRVTFQTCNGNVRLEIKDNGVGFDLATRKTTGLACAIWPPAPRNSRPNWTSSPRPVKVPVSS